MRDFEAACTSAGVLVVDFAQAVYKMTGLAELIAQGKDQQVVSRMRVVEESRSSARAIMIDAAEDFERKATPITGLPELLDRFSTRLAAAADMPLTLLMGQSPGGLNATGESDIRFFYDRIRAAQERTLREPIERVCKILFRALGITEPESWSIHFRPLWQPTDAEQATARYTQAQTDQIYITNGVVSAEEIALARFGSEDGSFATVIDFKARELLEPAAPPPAQLESENADPADVPEAGRLGARLPDVEEAELVDRADRARRNG
jgi:phage-related protein (TIGR01555 family)